MMLIIPAPGRPVRERCRGEVGSVMEILVERVAGLDVAKGEVKACVRGAIRPVQVERRRRRLLAELQALETRTSGPTPA